MSPKVSRGGTAGQRAREEVSNARRLRQGCIQCPPQPVDNVFGGGKKARDLWNVTLGEEQYRWFRNTLEGSKARFKFVFAHHVHGTGRGGIELAEQFEWGGADRSGRREFDARRPGWGKPIHQLMVDNGVTIFFQGHDHLYARQELNGVVYQTLPLPADPNYGLYNGQAYRSGTVLPGSGRLRVTVNPGHVTAQYLKSILPSDVAAQGEGGGIAHTYVAK